MIKKPAQNNRNNSAPSIINGRKLLNQRKYSWTWKELKTKTYKEAGICENIITTDDRHGINPLKIEQLLEISL